MADTPEPADIGGVEWYHTLDLGAGVVTPGWFDLRPVAAKLPWPDIAGMRCLDVGTFDGFWAFEMERRGAAKVVAVDVLDPAQWDWPYAAQSETVRRMGERKRGGGGFELAATALGSHVERHELSVYDLSSAALGTFDVVYVGSLLLHLRDPVRALERVREVCAGTLLVLDAIDLSLTVRHPRRPLAALDARGRPWWWKPNAAGLVRMVEAAGFELVEPPHRLLMPAGAGQQRRRPRARQLATRSAREMAFHTWVGDPHVVIRAKPRP